MSEIKTERNISMYNLDLLVNELLPELLLDRKFMLEALKVNPNIFYFLDKELQEDEDFLEIVKF